MFHFRKRKPTAIRQSIDERPLLERLADDLSAATARDEKARQAADRARSNLASVLPAELHEMLLEEQAAAAGLVDAMARLSAEKAAVQAQQEAEAIRREQAERAAKQQAFSDAMMAYRAACATLYPQALEVRRLAAEAGEYLPKPAGLDLLFDDFSEPHVAGVDVPLWRRG